MNQDTSLTLVHYKEPLQKIPLGSLPKAREKAGIEGVPSKWVKQKAFV